MSVDSSRSIQIENPSTSLPKRSSWVIYLVYGMLGPIAAFAKMGTVPLLILGLFGYPCFQAVISEGRRLIRTTLGLSALALLCWCALSLLWAEQANALTLLRLAGVIALAFLLPALMLNMDEPSRQALTNIVVGSFVFVLVVLLIEGLTDAWLHRQIRPEDAVPREGEWVPYLEMVAARGTAMLAPFAFLVGTLIALRTKRAVLGFGFAGLSCLASYMLPMEASAIAIIVGASVYALTWWRPRLFVNLVFLACTLALVCSPLVVSNLLNRSTMESMGVEVSRNEAQRLAIWEFSTQEIFKRPMFGHGFDSSRVIGARDNAVEGTNWQALPLHPHNAFLQIWLELGLIGVVLTCCLLFGLWKCIRENCSSSKDYAVCTSTWCALLTIALISFGVWQYWWIAFWGLLCGAMTLFLREPRPA